MIRLSPSFRHPLNRAVLLIESGPSDVRINQPHTAGSLLHPAARAGGERMVSSPLTGTLPAPQKH